MATYSFLDPTHFISICQGFSGQMRPQTRANIFISLLDDAYQASFANMEMERQNGPEGREPSMSPW